MHDPSFVIYLTDLVAKYGYAMVFLLIFLECIGIPGPGEITLVSAAVFAGNTPQLSISLVIAVAAAGAVLGGSVAFWLGGHVGVTFLERYGRYVHLTKPRLKIGQWLFLKYGGPIIFLGRFTVLLRSYASLLAGANKYSEHKFLFWNASGGIVWALVYGGGGFFFGHSIKYIAGPASIALFFVFAAGVVVLVHLFRKHEAWMLSEAERALENLKDSDA
jgi:membrane protein DedA with SNARE-associated domain